MKLKKVRFVVFLVLVFGALNVNAQNGSEKTLSLTLEEAQHYALSHNRNMQNASYDVKKAEASRWKAISTMLPALKVGYDLQYFCGHETDMTSLNPLASKMKDPTTGSFTATASIAFSGLQVVSAQLGTMAIEMADINQKVTKQEICSDVSQVYLNIVMLEQTLTLLRENLENLKALHVSTVESVRVGVAEETDADQLMVQVASMSNSINSTERALEMLYNSLRLLLGTDVSCELVLTNKVDDVFNEEKAMALLGEDFNINKNTNYQLLKKNTEVSKKQVTLNAWNWGPQLSAYYQYTADKQYWGGDVSPFAELMIVPNVVGVSVSMPIFTGGSNYGKYQEAKMAYNSAKNTLAMTADQLQIQNRQLRYNLNSAFENYKTQQSNLDVTRRVFNSTSQKFKYGTASSLDVTNASTNLILAQNNYISAMTDLVTAQIELEKLLNKW